MPQEEKNHRRFVEVFFHFVFWILVIHFLFDLGGLHFSLSRLFPDEGKRFVDEAFIFLPVAIGLFYWNLAYLTPKFLSKGKSIFYGISILFSFLFGYFLSACLYKLLITQGFIFDISENPFLDISIEFYLQTVILSTTVGIAKIALRNLSKKREAEQKQKNAELKYLANQFNPHFLYNTLNGIYSKAIEEDAPQTTEAILRLSEIMRYPINQGLKRQIPLVEEVAFINDYIALQKIRLGETYPVKFEQTDNIDDINILPLSLIILVENAFKYGVSQKNKSPIIFQLKLDANHIFFITENHIRTNDDKNSHKIGLQNLKERLKLVYQENYDLKTEQKENLYIITLKLEKK